MLGTSTHDTKRGEDTRARLAVLSEMAGEWSREVQGWSRILRARRGDVEGIAPPDRNDEYLLYQLLVGTLPVELFDTLEDAAALAAYTGRIKAVMVKSIREAKVHSTWASPNAAYEESVLSFVDEALDPVRAGSFLAALLPFVERVARLGAYNSLVQTVIKLTVPGHSRFLPGQRALGSQYGRPRQSAAGGLRAPPAAAGRRVERRLPPTAEAPCAISCRPGGTRVSSWRRRRRCWSIAGKSRRSMP